MGKRGTKCTPPSLPAYKWQQGLCAARFMCQELRGNTEKYLIRTSFCPPTHTRWLYCHIFGFFYALKSVRVTDIFWGVRGVYKESNWEVWLERLFLGTGGFF